MGVDDLSKFDLRLDLVSNKIKNFYLNKEKILLFFGRDRHYKGIETVEHLILKSDYNFLISTTNEKLILYKNLPNVMIVDELNIDEKVFVLRNSYLHLFPSSNRSESLGIALIESQMCSLPAIIYDLNSGSSVIIKNRFNGLMANSNSKDDYLKQLNELMNDSNLRSDLANNSRQNYLDNFTQKSFKKYLEKIENLNI
jgi:glycosyltransferase involved in cell wall biosynthesis